MVMDFLEAWREAEPYTMLGAERGRVLWDTVTEVTAGCFYGAIAELGVYRGGTALLLRRAAPGYHLHLFDTFTGHPDGSRAHDIAASQPRGRFGDVALSRVIELLEPTLPIGMGVGRSGLTIHAGIFPDTLRHAALPMLRFVHVDCDLYDSVAAACRIFWPALEHGGVLLFDDYGFPDCVGAKRAVDEWAAIDPELRELHLATDGHTLTGQAWVRKP